MRKKLTGCLSHGFSDCRRGKNTKFFHSKVLVRRRVNQMLGLEDGAGRWCEGEGEIRDIAISYFAQLFITSNPGNIEEIVGCVGS